MPLMQAKVSFRVVVCALAVAGAFSFARVARADELALDPSIELRTSVNDNFLFSASPSPTVLVLALTPRLSLSDDTETTKLRLDLSATSFTVLRQSADDHTNLNLGLSYEITDEKEKFRTTVGFVRDLTYEGELMTTGLLLAPLTRDDLSATASWTHSLTERLSTTLQFATDIARYSAPISGADASNYHYYALPVSVSYMASEEDTLTLAFTDSLYHADEIHDRSNSNEIQFALQHTFDERGVISLGVGEFESSTRLEQKIVVCPITPIYCELGLVPVIELESRQNSKASGAIVNGSVQYQLSENDTLVGHASRDLSPSGVGSLVLIESVDAQLKHNLDDESFLTLSYSRARSQILGATAGFANGFQVLGAAYSIRATQNATLEFGARRLATTHDQPGPAIHSDELYANFRYDWPNSSAAQAR
jgi:hypothetical protein